MAIKFLMIIATISILTGTKIIFYDINNNERFISVGENVIFILNFDDIFCKGCLVHLHKLLKNKYKKSLFIVNLNVQKNLILRIEKENHVKALFNPEPDFFIYNLKNIKLNKKQLLLVFKNNKVTIYTKKEIFDKDGKLNENFIKEIKQKSIK